MRFRLIYSHDHHLAVFTLTQSRTVSTRNFGTIFQLVTITDYSHVDLKQKKPWTSYLGIFCHNWVNGNSITPRNFNILPYSKESIMKTLSTKSVCNLPDQLDSTRTERRQDYASTYNRYNLKSIASSVVVIYRQIVFFVQL